MYHKELSGAVAIAPTLIAFSRTSVWSLTEIHGSASAREQYCCNFGVNPERIAILRDGPLAIPGSYQEGEVSVVELPGHPFFIGTLYVPQARSGEGRPHPLVSAFLRAVNGTRQGDPAGHTGATRFRDGWALGQAKKSRKNCCHDQDESVSWQADCCRILLINSEFHDWTGYKSVR
jgi:hypothetical protein